MKKRIAIILILGIFLLAVAGCMPPVPTTPITTPTVISPGEVALTMISQKVNAEATQMAVNVQFTATAQVIGVTVTAQARADGLATAEQQRRDAQATAAKEQAWAVATEQQRRQDAAATQARMDAVSTAEQAERNVIGTATAQQQNYYNGMTQQVLPTHAAWTQQAVEQAQIIATNEVELSNLQVVRQQKSNLLQAFGPYTVAAIAIVVAAVVMLRYSLAREFKNEETGVIEAVFLTDQKKMVRPQLLPGAVLDLSGKEPTVPLLTDAANQADIVRRAQGVEAIRSIPPNTSPQVLGDVMSGILGTSAPTPRFEILDATDAPPASLLDVEALKSLEQDWKESANE